MSCQERFKGRWRDWGREQPPLPAAGRRLPQGWKEQGEPPPAPWAALPMTTNLSQCFPSPQAAPLGTHRQGGSTSTAGCLWARQAPALPTAPVSDHDAKPTANNFQNDLPLGMSPRAVKVQQQSPLTPQTGPCLLRAFCMGNPGLTLCRKHRDSPLDINLMFYPMIV